MKKSIFILKFSLRLLFSPLIFFLYFAAMIIFPGTIMLGFGLILAFLKLTSKTEESWNEILEMMFSIIIVPIAGIYVWIHKGESLH
jgi:hypothetical protein